MNKKRPLTLIEIMVGIFLASTVIGVLLSSLRQIMTTKHAVQAIEKKVHARALLQLKLQDFFLALSDGSPLISDGKKLEGISEEKFHLDPVYAKEQKRALVLEQEILSFRIGDQQQHLLTGVESLNWSFFDHDKKKWVRSWKSSTLPLQIRLTVKQKAEKKPLIFTFYTALNPEIALS